MYSQPIARLMGFLFLITGFGIPFAAHADDSQALFKDLKQYIALSAAAYASVDLVENTARQYGYTVTKMQEIPAVELTYFLATDDINKRQVIAIRGTSNVSNAYVDMALKLKTESRLGVRLHEGFAFAAQAVYEDVKPLLRKDYRISTTGHSLGGAVAVILAMYLETDKYPLEHVITFGQPKVTNIAGAVQFKNLPLIRAVTPDDLVPLVPPFDPMDMSNLDIYWHLGEEVLLLPGQRYALLEGMEAMLRAVQFFGQPLTEDNVAHHGVAVYAQEIEAKQMSPELVPYESKINVFDLFGGR